jgi:hypothetical protein
MLIDKETSELVFIDRNTLTKVSVRIPRRRWTDWVEPVLWVLGFLGAVALGAIMLWTLYSTIAGMAEQSGKFMDNTVEQATNPRNIQGVY